MKTTIYPCTKETPTPDISERRYGNVLGIIDYKHKTYSVNGYEFNNFVEYLREVLACLKQ